MQKLSPLTEDFMSLRAPNGYRQISNIRWYSKGEMVLFTGEVNVDTPREVRQLILIATDASVTTWLLQIVPGLPELYVTAAQWSEFHPTEGSLRSAFVVIWNELTRSRLNASSSSLDVSTLAEEVAKILTPPEDLSLENVYVYFTPINNNSPFNSRLSINYMLTVSGSWCSYYPKVVQHTVTTPALATQIAYPSRRALRSMSQSYTHYGTYLAMPININVQSIFASVTLLQSLYNGGAWASWMSNANIVRWPKTAPDTDIEVLPLLRKMKNAAPKAPMRLSPYYGLVAFDFDSSSVSRTRSYFTCQQQAYYPDECAMAGELNMLFLFAVLLSQNDSTIDYALRALIPSDQDGASSLLKDEIMPWLLVKIAGSTMTNITVRLPDGSETTEQQPLVAVAPWAKYWWAPSPSVTPEDCYVVISLATDSQSAIVRPATWSDLYPMQMAYLSAIALAAQTEHVYTAPVGPSWPVWRGEDHLLHLPEQFTCTVVYYSYAEAQIVKETISDHLPLTPFTPVPTSYQLRDSYYGMQWWVARFKSLLLTEWRPSRNSGYLATAIAFWPELTYQGIDIDMSQVTTYTSNGFIRKQDYGGDFGWSAPRYQSSTSHSWEYDMTFAYHLIYDANDKTISIQKTAAQSGARPL